MGFCLSTNIGHIWEQPAEFCGYTAHLDRDFVLVNTRQITGQISGQTSRWIGLSGVNGKPVYRISFRLGRNDEIRKEYLSTGY